MRVGQELVVHRRSVRLLNEKSRLAHLIVDVVSDEQKSFDTCRDHYQCDGYSEQSVENAEYLAAR